MLTSYIDAAMSRATGEWLADGRVYHSEITGFPGVWASGGEESEAKAELRDVLESWIVLGLTGRDPIPEIDGLDLRVELVGSCHPSARSVAISLLPSFAGWAQTVPMPAASTSSSSAVRNASASRIPSMGTSAAIYSFGW